MPLYQGGSANGFRLPNRSSESIFFVDDPAMISAISSFLRLVILGRNVHRKTYLRSIQQGLVFIRSWSLSVFMGSFPIRGGRARTDTVRP